MILLRGIFWKIERISKVFDSTKIFKKMYLTSTPANNAVDCIWYFVTPLLIFLLMKNGKNPTLNNLFVLKTYQTQFQRPQQKSIN